MLDQVSVFFMLVFFALPLILLLFANLVYFLLLEGMKYFKKTFHSQTETPCVK